MSEHEHIDSIPYKHIYKKTKLYALCVMTKYRNIVDDRKIKYNFGLLMPL